MKLAVFSTLFAAVLVAAVDPERVPIASDPPDGVDACTRFQDPKCCVELIVCQCYDGNYYYANADNTCTPDVGDKMADDPTGIPGYCC
ncbi:hypothetical protein PG990_003281 [Apiospora arundinis]|uniref:Uncharacterized protein n=1 Tax=Apiospora arundinis TaxID=335852 RepID=A0ABR2IHP1_9PEZI